MKRAAFILVPVVLLIAIVLLWWSFPSGHPPAGPAVAEVEPPAPVTAPAPATAPTVARTIEPAPPAVAQNARGAENPPNPPNANLPSEAPPPAPSTADLAAAAPDLAGPPPPSRFGGAPADWSDATPEEAEAVARRGATRNERLNAIHLLGDKGTRAQWSSLMELGEEDGDPTVRAAAAQAATAMRLRLVPPRPGSPARPRTPPFIVQ